MKVRAYSVAIAANTPTRLLNIGVKNLHNFIISFGTNSTYMGGPDINSGNGIPFNNGDAFSMTYQDFQRVDDNLDLWAICATSATCYVWSMEIGV